jgi:putative tricarboxylic transport membrane protein
VTRADAGIGGVLAAIFAVMAWQATRLTYGTEFAPGPGFTPLWLGIFGAVIAAFIAVRGRAASPAPPTDLRAEARVGLAVLGVGVALLAVPLLGFVTAFAVYLLFFTVVIERLGLPVALAASFGVAGFIYLVFARLLGVPFPVGPLGF